MKSCIACASLVSRSLLPLWLIPTLLIGSAPARTQEAGWSAHFSPQSLGGLEPYELKITPGDGVLGLGRAELPGSAAAYVLVKFGENGDYAWSHTVQYQVSPAGNSPFVEDSAAVDVDPDGDIFLVTNNRERGRVTKLDSAGAVLWQRTLEIVGTFSTLQYTDIDASIRGEVVVSGVRITDPAIALPYDDVVMLRGSDGTVRWRKTTTAATTRDQGLLTLVQRGPAGEILLTGQTDTQGYSFQPRALVLDANGGVLWHASLDPMSNANHTALDAAIDAAGQVTILSSMTIGAIPHIRLTRFDSGGVQLSDVIRAASSGHGLLLHPSGDTWVAGAVFLNPAIIRFNSAGQFVSSSGVPAAAGQLGTLNRLVVDIQGTVHAVGTRESGSSTDLALLAAFSANGTSLHSQVLEGMPPTLVDERFGGVDIVLDSRGNPLTLSQSTSASTGDLQIVATKTVEGGVLGSGYCGPAVVNSTGVPASLELIGAAEVGVNNLSLRVRDLPASTVVLLLASRTRGLTQQAGGGQGTLCLGGAIGRYVAPGQVRIADAQGSAYLQVELSTMPQPTGLVPAFPGETWNFQAWYRDGLVGGTSNFSDGASIVLQ